MSSVEALHRFMELVDRLRRMVPDGSPEIRKVEDEIRRCSLIMDERDRRVAQYWIETGFDECLNYRYGD